MSIRPNLILASKHDTITESLKQYVGLFVGEDLPHKIDPTTYTSQEELLAKLDGLKREEIFNTVVVYDLTMAVGSDSLRITATDCFPAEVILSYPEIYWIFIHNGSIPSYKKDVSLDDITQKQHFVCIADMSSLARLLKRHAGGFRTLFDPTGLRWQIGRYCRSDANDKEKHKETDELTETGASIDEEKSFALLNGYLLYRYGYGTYMITTLSEMINVCTTKPKLTYTIEDINLRFPDANAQEEEDLFLVLNEKRDPDTIFLENRKELFTFLESEERIIVSQSSLVTESNGSKNYISLQKPFGGIFEQRLPPKLTKHGCIQFHDDGKKTSSSSFNHSAPNKNQKIAESLMRRARIIADKAMALEDAVHAGVLAEEAKRLLSGKTLALSLEALKVKHCMEVTAECTFVGASDSLNVENRFQEIDAEIKKMAPDNRRQQYSALVEISDDLRQIYHEYEQFDEEETALIKVRDYRWELKYRTNEPSVNLTKCVAAFVNWYFNFLIKSARHLISAIAAIIILFGIAYSVSINWPDVSNIQIDTLYDAMEFSTLTFFEMQPAEVVTFKEVPAFLLLIELALAYAHLGIFISYLYQKISRK